MYHIKSDSRSAKSACLVCSGLSEALKKKPYRDISISEACSVHGIARSTFYRLFDTLDDVLLYQFDLLFENSLQESAHSGEPYPKIILRIALSDKTLLSALADSGRTDLFDFTTRNRENDILSHLEVELGAPERLYCTPLLNAMMCAVLRTWLSTGSKETLDELYDIIKNDLALICRCM